MSAECPNPFTYAYHKAKRAAHLEGRGSRWTRNVGAVLFIGSAALMVKGGITVEHTDHQINAIESPCRTYDPQDDSYDITPPSCAAKVPTILRVEQANDESFIGASEELLAISVGIVGSPYVARYFRRRQARKMTQSQTQTDTTELMVFEMRDDIEGLSFADGTLLLRQQPLPEAPHGGD